MNQSQLNLLNHPNVQILIQEFGFEPITKHDPLITNIQNRIEQWFEEFQNPITKSPFKSTQEIAEYITSNRQKYGNAWCPF